MVRTADEERPDETDEVSLLHRLPAGDAEEDRRYVKKLDDDTRLRRRVYDLLLATKCFRLEKVDGLPFRGEDFLKKDEVWERLLGLGVVEKMENAEKQEA